MIWIELTMKNKQGLSWRDTGHHDQARMQFVQEMPSQDPSRDRQNMSSSHWFLPPSRRCWNRNVAFSAERSCILQVPC